MPSCSHAVSPEDIQKARNQTGGAGFRPDGNKSIRGSAPQGHGHAFNLVPAAQPEIGFEMNPSLLQNIRSSRGDEAPLFRFFEPASGKSQSLLTSAAALQSER